MTLKPEGYQPEGMGLDTSKPPQGGSGVPPKPPLIIIIKKAIPTADAIAGIYLEPRGSHETDPFAEQD